MRWKKLVIYIEKQKMKKIWLLILWLCSLFFLWNFTQAKDYEYTNLDITADVLIDWTINVKEDFTANFFVDKHGIIRDIPLNYSVGWYKFHIDVSNFNVEWKNFTTSNNNWNIEIKIWDANRTVIWEQNYPISYTTYGLIRNFSWLWYAELYWNIVWYDFDTNINKVRAVIKLPKPYTWFTSDNFLITTDGTSKTVEEFEWRVDWSNWDKIIITYDKWLSAYHGITLSMNLPKDYFTFDHDKQAKLIWYSSKTSWDFSLLKWLLVFWLVGLSTFLITRKMNPNIIKKTWALKWKFAKKFPTIIQYEPPKWLNSAEVWLLFHRKAKPKDMLSLIYKRATDWLITISTWNKEKKKYMQDDDVIIIKNKDIPSEYPDYEKDFFNDLVANKENIIKKSRNIYNKLKLPSLEIYGEDKWWLINAKNSIGTIFLRMSGSVFLCIFLMTLFIILITTCDNIIITLPAWILIVFTPLIFIYPILYSLSDKKEETEEWARLISHILWYRDFLATCDENKLRLFLQQDPLYFDKILPYAVVFGLDTELIKKIEPIMQEMGIKSSWYDWDIHSIHTINYTISSSATHSIPPHYDSNSWFSSYDSDSWFSGWSSFSWWSSSWFSSWWGWGWWGGRSW